METVTTWILNIGAVVLALLILATLVRAVLGPRFTDRIVAVNVIGTLVIAELMVLSVRLRADYLVDIALVFALLSFLSVVVAFQLVMSRQKNKRREEKQEGTAMIEHLATGAGWPSSCSACSCFSLLSWGCSGSTMCSTGCTPRRWEIPWASSAC